MDAAISTLQEEQNCWSVTWMDNDCDSGNWPPKEVVVAETCVRLRARRDDGWMSVRRAYIDRCDRDQLPPGFRCDQGCSGGLQEAAVGEADRQADLLQSRRETMPPALTNARGASS